MSSQLSCRYSLEGRASKHPLIQLPLSLNMFQQRRELEHWYRYRTSCQLDTDHRKCQQLSGGILKENPRSRRSQQHTFQLLCLGRQSFLLFHKHTMRDRGCSHSGNSSGVGLSTCQWGMHTFCSQAKLASLLRCKLESNSSIPSDTSN